MGLPERVQSDEVPGRRIASGLACTWGDDSFAIDVLALAGLAVGLMTTEGELLHVEVVARKAVA
jgi:hypothetical protein